MPRVVHVVTTDNFAGAERYVCEVAAETAARGWDVAVVGGDPMQMREALGDGVRWRPGSRAVTALRSLATLGRYDICHAHMTLAEAVALAGRPLHGAPVVSTRHFAAHRGSTRSGRLAAPWIAARLTREIAVSDFVARRLERPPDAVIHPGVRPWPLLWRPENHVVLVLQRLEPEKDTSTALRAWRLSGLADEGWTLRIAGDGAERRSLEEQAAMDDIPRVEFTGWQPDIKPELGRAGILLAAAPAEPFGLSVLEAMAAGVPIVASAAGGHLETVGLLPNAALFCPGDAAAASAALRSFGSEAARVAASRQGREHAVAYSIERVVDQLLSQYDHVLRSMRRSTENAVGARER